MGLSKSGGRYMTESVSILSLMVKDHSKIESLITKLEEKSHGDFENMSEAFKKFEWEL